jgi:ketosteroid isomerase-like protein
VTDAEAVLSAVRARAEALAAGDPERLTRLLHEQFVWTSHRGDVFNRSSYVIANTRDLAWRSQVVDNPRVTVVGEAAVVVGIVRDEVERAGDRAEFEMRFTQTWVRQGRQWLCLAGHAGPLVN